jgi:hypothetical protein
VRLVDNIGEFFAVFDQNNMPIASLINTPNGLGANNRVMKYGKKIGMTVTKGGYVGSFHNFANPQVINNLFTRLLNLNKNFYIRSHGLLKY